MVAPPSIEKGIRKMDVFREKSYRPMLIGRESPPFDDEDYLFELKLDGIRCLAYADSNGLSLITRRGLELAPRFPELHGITRSVAGACIIDGELIALKEGVPDFEEIKGRALGAGLAQAERMAKESPISLVVFDILYAEGEDLTKNPLAKRRERLEEVVRETERLALTRPIEGQGLALFDAARAHGLEGIIAKRKNSLYFPGKRSPDWVKCKNLLDDDFVICGYILNKNNSVSLILGQYAMDGKLVYKGKVVLYATNADYASVLSLAETGCSPFDERLPAGNDDAVWVELKLVCRVDFLSLTKSGLMRHPHYRGIRIDKAPADTRSRRGRGIISSQA